MALNEKQVKNLRKHNAKQREIKNGKRYKVCLWCDENFIDTSKRLTQRTCCKECSCKFGVSVRMKNGSYKQSKEQVEKIQKILANMKKEGKCKISKEKREILSKNLKGRWASGEMKEAIIKTYLEKYGVEHWTQTPEGREKMSAIHTGKIVSANTRRKMSEKSSNQIHRFSKCHGGIRDDLGIYFRSSWEANYARMLKYKNIYWEYEPDIFNLSNGWSYTPDFKLNNNIYVEIKGWQTDKFKEKFTLFKNEYPDVIINLLRREEYKKIYIEFCNIIPFWEKIEP